MGMPNVLENDRIIHRFPWGTSEEAQVLIVHFGSKSTPMIAQQLRQIGLRSRTIQGKDIPIVTASGYRPELVIFSGGPDSVLRPNAPTISDADLYYLMERGPVFGICYGFQLLAQKLGGEVAQARVPEFGEVTVKATRPFGAYIGGTAIMNHTEEILRLPKYWEPFAHTNHCAYALAGTYNVYGAMFHPELDADGGDELLRHLAFDLAYCKPDYTFDMERYVEESIRWMRQTVSSGEVELGLSGGVDSAVAFALARHAYGKRLHATFVDNGLMREGEREEVQGWFGTDGISYVRAGEEFLRQIESIPYTGPDPEGEERYYGQVRDIIGKCFIETFALHARQNERRPVALVQGTNHADVIESTTGLKAHHNVGALPQRLEVAVVEPLAGLFKFEIRQLAEYLGLPHEVAWRQPLPGPGFAIRMWGPVTRIKINALRQAMRIFEEIICQYYPDPKDRPLQYFVEFSPLASCGHMGDEKVYGQSLAIRGYARSRRESYMNLRSFQFPWELIYETERRLTNEVRMDDGTRITRVFVDVTAKPGGTGEPQ